MGGNSAERHLHFRGRGVEGSWIPATLQNPTRRALGIACAGCTAIVSSLRFQQPPFPRTSFLLLRCRRRRAPARALDSSCRSFDRFSHFLQLPIAKTEQHSFHQRALLRLNDENIYRTTQYTTPPMAPIDLTRALSGKPIRQLSRSVSSHLASHNTPSVITSVLNLLTRLTTRRLHQSSPPSILLSKRQTQILAIPTTYEGLDSGPQPGTVVGIVLGSVAGFLILLWLLYTCANVDGFPGFSGWGRRTVVEEEIIRRRSRSRSHSRSRSRVSRASRTETAEVLSVARSPVRRETRRETIVVEERRTSRPSPPREDDIVEVIEEHSPVRRPSRRESKRASGFRTVDPAEFGGGDRPMRKVSRR